MRHLYLLGALVLLNLSRILVSALKTRLAAAESSLASRKKRQRTLAWVRCRFSW